jgi:AcrR family transcriptional regulator
MSGDGKQSARRDQHSEDTRLAILKAARDAFAQKGYANTSLEDIVAPARLTKGALYHHFASKAAVLEALYVEMEEQLATLVQSRMANASDNAQSRIEAALDAFLDASSEPAYVRIVLRDAPNVLGHSRGRALDHAIGLDLVLALVQSLKEDGMMPDLPLEATARMLLSASSEVVVSMAYSEDPERVRREGRAVVLAIFEGLALKARKERSREVGS